MGYRKLQELLLLALDDSSIKCERRNPKQKRARQIGRKLSLGKFLRLRNSYFWRW